MEFYILWTCILETKSVSQPQRFLVLSKAGYDRKGHKFVPGKNKGHNSLKVTTATVRKVTNKPEVTSFGNGGDSSSEGKEYDYLIQSKQINNVQNKRIKAPKECS